MSEVKSRLCFLTPTRLNQTYPLFIFLPGMDGTGKLLRAQTAGLEAAFDVRCLAIPPDDLTGWEGLTEQVVDLIQAELKTAPRPAIYLCGESFGGCLAMKVALTAPQLFERIILVNPASSFNQRPWIGWGTSLAKWFPQPLYQYFSVALLPFLASLERIGPADRQALVEAVRFVPQSTSVWRLSLLSQFRLEKSQLQSLTQPILVIASEADRLLPSLAEADKLVESLPNAHRVILPDSGHACLLEAEINFYEILRTENFLRQYNPASREGAASNDY